MNRTRFEDRLLTSIVEDHAALTAARTPRKETARIMRTLPLLLSGAAAAALVVGATFAVTGSPSTHTAPGATSTVDLTHVQQTSDVVKLAVDAIAAAGPVLQTTVKTDGRVAITTVNAQAQITSTTYQDTQGTLQRVTAMRANPDGSGTYQLIELNYQNHTWMQLSMGKGTTIPDPAGQMLDQLKKDANGDKGTHVSTQGTSVVNGEPVKILVVSGPNGEGADTVSVSTRTGLPVQSQSQGAAVTYGWNVAGADNGASLWPSVPAGFTEVAASQDAFR